MSGRCAGRAATGTAPTGGAGNPRSPATCATWPSGRTAASYWRPVRTTSAAPGHGDAGPRRDPYFTILRSDDRFVLAGPGREFEVTPGTARRWLGLDGTAVAGGAVDIDHLLAINAAR
ncbi:hypothetical protein [Spongiactinospora sp. TRM90649]|uniref:hypothetical protein n=1 Tax=Spongiactinospora sp. TRM90649 TaxID=3031114 RepID=UPI0023F8D447|nr:hypothetical protein [Spongiactinospora sp. TRM90649]MDF5754536.1 hypothetical protein [Spongiactinospora sp. TRM90649]